MSRGLDTDGRVITPSDLRTLIQRYGFQVASIVEHPPHVRALVYPTWNSPYHDTPEDTDRVLAGLRAAVEAGRCLGVTIEVETVPAPAVSDGSAYR